MAENEKEDSGAPKQITNIKIPEEYREQYNKFFKKYGTHRDAFIGMMLEADRKKSGVDEIDDMRGLGSKFNVGEGLDALKQEIDSETAVGLSLAQKERLKALMKEFGAGSNDPGVEEKPVLTKEDLAMLKEIRKMNMMFKMFSSEDMKGNTPQHDDLWIEDRREQRRHELELAETKAEAKKYDNMMIVATMGGGDKKNEMLPFLQSMIQGNSARDKDTQQHIIELGDKFEEQKEKTREKEMGALKDGIDNKIDSLKDVIAVIADNRGSGGDGDLPGQLATYFTKVTDLNQSIVGYGKSIGLTEKETKTVLDNEGYTPEAIAAKGFEVIQDFLKIYADHKAKKAASQETPQTGAGAGTGAEVQYADLTKLSPDEQQQLMGLVAKSQGGAPGDITSQEQVIDPEMDIPQVDIGGEPALNVPPDKPNTWSEFQRWCKDYMPNATKAEVSRAWHDHKKTIGK